MLQSGNFCLGPILTSFSCRFATRTFLYLEDSELCLHTSCPVDGVSGGLQQSSHRAVNSSFENPVFMENRWVLGFPSSAEKQLGRLRSRAVMVLGINWVSSWSRTTRIWGCGSTWGWDHLAVGSFQFPKAEPGTLLQTSAMEGKKVITSLPPSPGLFRDQKFLENTNSGLMNLGPSEHNF